MCEVLNIENVKQIPGYNASEYQTTLTKVVSEYIKIMGIEPFNELRFMKDIKGLNQFQDILANNEEYKIFGTEEYIQKKKNIIQLIKNSENISDKNKQYIIDFFEKYKDIYFSTNLPENYVERLDNILEEIFNFSSLKGHFDVITIDSESNEPTLNQKNLQLYQSINTLFHIEALSPLTKSISEIENFKKSKNSISMHELTKQALQALPRTSEMQTVPNVNNLDNEKKLEGEIK